jgi:pyrroline-5-carboxylate reductase
MKAFGFIGVGNMAGAMIGGILKSGKAAPSDLIGSCRSPKSRERVKEKYGIEVTDDNRRVAESCEILFLSVKPQMLDDVIGQIRGSVREDQLLVTIAAGRSISYYEEAFGNENLHLVRLMPNTPALVGEAMTAACGSASVTSREMEKVGEIAETFGLFEIVPERLFDAVTGVSGSSPAYVFMMLEAMADAAVAGGMPRAQAYKFAAQAVLGSAKMLLDTGMHPGELKDMVCSPAGTTIEAVRVLEEKGLRSAVFEGTRACIDRSAAMNAPKNRSKS